MGELVGNIFNFISYYTIGKVVFGIGYIFAWLGGVVIGIESWLVGTMLSINTGVFDSQIVKVGFGISLSFANLGFVLGIIIIALATILRRDNYGVKQLLWKLVIAAILVNFSLVIMAPIFSFTNSLSQYFLNCIDATVGCNNPQGLSFGTSMNNFAQSLVGAFNPQNGFTAMNQVTASSTGVTNNPNLQGSLAVEAGQGLGGLMTPILSVFSIAASLSIFVITLGALIVMLLIRYIYIAILAILMPFAWLMWVFPKMSSHWSKWWHNFIKWSFFSPIVLFFLYLAMITAQSMSNGTNIQSQNFASYTSSSNAAWAAIATFFTNLFTPVFATLLNQIVYAALCIGGIFAANSMGIAGADAAIKTMGSVRDSAMGYIGKQSKKGARATYRAAGGEKLTQNLQRGNIGILGRIPLARRGATLAGQKIASVSDNSALVEQAKKNIPAKKEDRLRMMEGSVNMETRMALFEAMEKDGQLGDIKTIDGKEANRWDWLNKNKSAFTSYGKSGEGSLQDKVWDKTGLTEFEASEANKKLKEKNQELDAKRNVADEDVMKKAGFTTAETEEYERLKRKDQNPDDLFTAKEEMKYLELSARENKARATLGLDDADQEEYNKNKEEIEKNGGKILKANKDPEAAAAHFINDEKARKKFEDEGEKVPPWLEKDYFKRSQQEFLQLAANKYSAQNMSELLKAVGKGNNFEGLENAITNMKNSNTEAYSEFTKALSVNKGLVGYLRNNSGKNLMPELDKIFKLRNLKEEPKKKDKKDNKNDDDDEEEDNAAPANPTPPPATP